MPPRSRLLVLGTVAGLVLAAGCQNEAPTQPVSSEVGLSGGRNGTAKGPGFSGTLSFGTGKTTEKARVTVVDENLRLIVSGTGIADSSGKFTVRPAPTRVYFVQAEGAGSRLMSVVQPVDEKSGDEPEIKLNAASTLASAGILPLFSKEGQFDLRDLSVELFSKLVAAVEATSPAIDLTKDPRDHLAAFKQLYESNAGVKAAYDALFADLRSKFEKRNPGLPVPTPPGPTGGPGGTGTPTATPTTGSTFATPSPTPTPDPNATATPTPTPTPVGATPTPTPTPVGATPSPTPEPTPTPTPTPSPTPTPPLVVKLDLAPVLDTVDGADVKLSNANDPFFNMAKLDFGLAQVLAMPDSDKIWFVDSLQTKFQKIDIGALLANGGTPPVVAGTQGFGVDGTKLIFAARVDGLPKVITMTGAAGVPPTYTATARTIAGTTPGSFSGHAFYEGNLYVASPGENAVFKISPTSGDSVLFMGGGEPGAFQGEVNLLDARMNKPIGVAIIGDFMYVCDQQNNRLLKVDLKAGKAKVYAGDVSNFQLINGPLGGSRYAAPSSLMADGKKLIVGDQGHSAIREIDTEREWVASYANSLNEATAGGQLVNFVRGAGRLSPTVGFSVGFTGNVSKLTFK